MAESVGTRAVLIGSASELNDEMFRGVETVGVTSGASAPEEQVQMVLDDLYRRGAVHVEEVAVCSENVAFVLPKELLSLSRSLKMAPST